MTIHDWSKVPGETWASLGHECATEDRWTEMRPEFIRAVQAVIAAAKVPQPPRTRAEVDAERLLVATRFFEGPSHLGRETEARKRWNELNDEPTRDSGPWSTEAHSSASRCECASRHLKVIGDFEAEATTLRSKLEEIADWFADAEGAVKNIRRILGEKAKDA